MLQLNIVADESFDEEKNQFVPARSIVLELEHSLVSVSKWECIYEVPFLSNEKKTNEQVLEYIRCMNLRGDFPEEVFTLLKDEHYQTIDSYINAKMTATWIREQQSTGRKEIITNELVYYWMTALNIPFECQYWHLERLLTLIKVCNAKNAPKAKVNTKDMLAERRALNDKRRAESGSRG